MPKQALVTICYGPDECSGIVKHQTFRLQGLQAALKARGHRCVLEDSCERNRVELVGHGEVVFECHIKQLEFASEEKAEPYVLSKKHGCTSLCQLAHVSW